MTTELRAPDPTGVDTRPKRSRTKTLLPWLVLAVWVGLPVGGYALAGLRWEAAGSHRVKM